MKKNFFKKLSFVLALAMIVSVIAPASGAFAATTAKLNATKKTLYLGATKEYDFNISGKQAGWTYKWTSANTKVVTVAQNGLTTAVGVGTTTVSVVIKKATKWVATLKASVSVKDSIASVEIANGPTDGKLAVGTTFDFNRSFKTASGSTTRTSSITRWAVDKAGATIDDAGIFTATVAGKYVVTARSFKSTANYTAWKADTTKTALVSASDTTEVTAFASMKSAVQVDGTSFKVTFDSAMAAVTATDLTVNKVAAAGLAKVPQSIKEIKLSEDKTYATVTLYNTIAAGATYVVSFTGAADVQFVAATTDVKDVNSMTITPATVEVNTATDLAIKLFNTAGVDITTADLLARVTVKSSSERVYLNEGVAPRELTIFNVGDATTLTATFHTYSYDTTTGLEKDTKTAEAVITGVAVAANPVSTLAAWTLAASAPSDFSDVNHVIAAEDASTNLYVRALKADAKTYVNNLGVNTNFKFTSTDSSVLVVFGNTVWPVKTGVASVIVEYSNSNFVTANDSVVVATIPVSVTAKRVATTLTLGSLGFSLSNSPAVGDTKSVSIKVADQYGKAMTVSGVEVNKLTTTLASNLAGAVTVVSATENSVVFAGSGAVDGSYAYEIKANKLSKYIVINVQAPTAVTATSYRLNVDAASYDSILKSDSVDKNATVRVYGYSANGIANQLGVVSGSVFSVSGTALTVKLYKPDGTEITTGANALTFVPAATSASISILDVDTAPVTKMEKGVYTLKLFEGTVVKDLVTFEVKDTQVAPVVSTKKLIATSASATTLLALNEIFEVTANSAVVPAAGNPLTFIASDIIGGGKDVFVKNVRYTETIGTKTVEHVIAVNTAVTLYNAY